MDWSYVAGFFDGEGNIHVQKILDRSHAIKAYQIVLRIYNNDLEVLTKIKEFLGCGRIYLNGGRKDADRAHELSISRKEEVKFILDNLKIFCVSKRIKIDYLLKNYIFERDNNSSFNLQEFHSLGNRKNVEKFYVHRHFKQDKPLTE